MNILGTVQKAAGIPGASVGRLVVGQGARCDWEVECVHAKYGTPAATGIATAMWDLWVSKVLPNATSSTPPQQRAGNKAAAPKGSPQWELVEASAEPVIGPRHADVVSHGIFNGLICNDDSRRNRALRAALALSAHSPHACGIKARHWFRQLTS